MNVYKVIGKRKSGLIALYLFTLLFGIFFILFPGFFHMDTNGRIVIIAIGIILTAVCLYIIIAYAKTPVNAILYDRRDTIYIKNQAVRLSDIKDVSYRRARARGVQYKWGSITVITKSDVKYKVNYIADCEEVCKALTKLVYEKNSDTAFTL